MAVEVPLVNAASVALVDDQDADRVLARRWRIEARGPGRGQRVVSADSSSEGLHRFVLLSEPDVGIGREHVTALSGDYLDCRRANLQRRFRCPAA